MKTIAITCSDINDLKTYGDNGADEVIFAPEKGSFSAMQEMKEEEIIRAVETAHACGMRVSVLMNRLFGQSEISNAGEQMIRLVSAGVDHVIFADPGMLACAHENGFENRMIYQPDTLVTSAMDASFWMEQGLYSTVLSSLITKNEIREITEKVHGLSLVVHGRLMMSVSKRKLLEAFKEETGLRFDNAYNRNLYLVEEKREGRMPVYETDYACMIFSDYVQESFDEMPSFTAVERYVIDTTFLEKEEALDALRIYRGLVAGKDMQEEISSYRNTYGKEERLSDGYYGQKTVR